MPPPERDVPFSSLLCLSPGRDSGKVKSKSKTKSQELILALASLLSGTFPYQHLGHTPRVRALNEKPGH